MSASCYARRGPSLPKGRPRLLSGKGASANGCVSDGCVDDTGDQPRPRRLKVAGRCPPTSVGPPLTRAISMDGPRSPTCDKGRYHMEGGGSCCQKIKHLFP